ncbi:MAG: M14 family zinc carboxypeptidase [Candidatus Sulfotelmatobacter sp.]
MFRRAVVGVSWLAMLTVLWTFLLTFTAIAQNPDIPEPGSVEAIAAATTDPHYVSPWVSYIPQSATVPSPEKFLSRIMGAPGELLGTEKSYAYARALAAASPRVRVFTIGHSEEGREIVILAIADEAGIRDLDRLKAATAALADPRRTDQAAADKLIASARPVYYFNAALHSDETGSTEAMLELAYRLAVSEQPMIRRIREQLVVLINPISNPDGRDKMVDWFYRYLKGKTDRNTLPRQSPPYWSKYAFVDINRDTHQQTHETTKAVHRMFHEWHPTVVHDLHEGSPLMMTWNGTGPYNPNIDPITYTEFLELSFHEVEAMTAMGMPGVSTWNFGEAFAHLYLDSVAMNHNSIGRGFETFGNGSAETEKRSISPSSAKMEWYRPLPAPREVTWSARDNLNYQETGALAALDESASHSKEMLRNFYRKGWDSWQKGLTEPPYAFLIPEDQGDPARVAQMVGRLMGQKIEVARAQNPIQIKEGNFPAGTYVVRLDQPYRNYAVDLLTPQHYPKDGEAPYDDVSWELPANYHLQAIATADASIRDIVYLASISGLPNMSSTPAARSFPQGRGSLPIKPGFTMRLCRLLRNWDSTSPKSRPSPMCRRTRRRRRALACGYRGRILTRSDGSVIHWINAKSLTPICAMRTFAPGISAVASTSCFTDTSISNWRSRLRVCRKPGHPCRSRKPHRLRVSARPPNPTTSPAELATKDSRRFNASSTMED